MARFFKKIFSSFNRYSLTISNVYYRSRELFCTLSDNTNLNPYQVLVKEIFSNDDLLSKIKPRELLKLKEIYVLLAESYPNNKFKVAYHDREFLMIGKDICKDMNLLKSMRFCDAFKIIYDTAAQESAINAEKLETLKKPAENKEKICSRQNVIFMGTDWVR